MLLAQLSLQKVPVLANYTEYLLQRQAFKLGLVNTFGYQSAEIVLDEALLYISTISWGMGTRDAGGLLTYIPQIVQLSPTHND